MLPTTVFIPLSNRLLKVDGEGLVQVALPVEIEASIDVEVPSEGLLATKVGRSTDGDVKVGLERGELLSEEAAVGTDTMSSLLNVGSLELDTSRLVHAEHAHYQVDPSGLLVDDVLFRGVRVAKSRVEGAGESLLTDAVRLLVVELVAAVLGLAARRRKSRRSVSRLVVTVGTDNDDLEAALVAALVGSSLLLDFLSPDGALELSDRRCLAAALLLVELGVTLDEDVEASACLGLIAVGSACRGVVRGEKLVGEVSASLYGALEVGEGLSVSSGGLSVLCKVRVDSVALEGVDSVGHRGRSVSVGLSSARVERVDEAAVGTDLDSGRACRVGSESPSIGPAHWRAAIRSSVGGGRVVGRRSGSGRSRRRSYNRVTGVGLHRLRIEPPKGASLKIGTSTLLGELS
ncbi:hypothetical protein HBI67_029010 [Parastagonospora nodorum]|nr:hypothetical protein HBI67_029010 [Parastagonospora nodorum]